MAVRAARAARLVRTVRAVRWALESPHARVYRVWARPYAVCAGVGVATYGALKGAWVLLGGAEAGEAGAGTEPGLAPGPLA